MALNSDVLQLIFMHFAKVMGKPSIKLERSSGDLPAPQRVVMQCPLRTGERHWQRCEGVHNVAACSGRVAGAV